MADCVSANFFFTMAVVQMHAVQLKLRKYLQAECNKRKVIRKGKISTLRVSFFLMLSLLQTISISSKWQTKFLKMSKHVCESEQSQTTLVVVFPGVSGRC